jgi:hypothetical protein
VLMWFQRVDLGAVSSAAQSGVGGVCRRLRIQSVQTSPNNFLLNFTSSQYAALDIKMSGKKVPTYAPNQSYVELQFALLERGSVY